MRKTLVSILSLLLTVGFSASAFAGHAADTGYEYTPKLVKSSKSNIDLSGSIRIRGDFRDNTNDFNSETADQTSGYNSRIRLKVDATVSPNTKGVVELENGTGTNDTYTWGTPSGANFGAEGTYDNLISNNGDGNIKPDTLSIRQAYISTQGTNLLGVLSGAKVGHILTKLGNGVFYNHSKFGDDAIVFWTVPQKGTEVSLTMAKLGENTTTATQTVTCVPGPGCRFIPVIAGNNDATSYTLAATTAAAGINLGADVTYIDDQDFTSYTPAGGSLVTEGLHLWNLGLNANMAVNGVSLYGDVEVQSGKAKENHVNPITSLRSDMKFKGYAWVLGAKADVPNSPITAGLEAGYGSGDKMEDCANVACTTKYSGNKNEAFLTTIGNSGNLGVRQIAFLYDDKIATASGAGNNGLSNTWYINLGGSANVNPDLNLALDVFYLRAAKARNVMGALEANGQPKTSKSIGTEVDAKLTYQVDTNLVYYIESGYMFAGSMYDYDNPAVVANGDNLRADNPYGIRHGLELTF